MCNPTLSQAKTERTYDSSIGSTSSADFLDTINDNYDPYTYCRLPEPRRAVPEPRRGAPEPRRPPQPRGLPELLVRGVKKDFIDVVDSLYENQFIKQPIAAPYVGHVTKNQPISEQYCDKENRAPGAIKASKSKRLRNRQFYLKKEWLK